MQRRQKTGVFVEPRGDGSSESPIPVIETRSRKDFDTREFRAAQPFQQGRRQTFVLEASCGYAKVHIKTKNAIISFMFLRSTAVFLLVCACVSSAFGQSAGQFQGSISVDSDLRLFAMAAAVNAAGFDVELGSQYHPVRAEVRKFADALDPDLKRRRKQFYELHKEGQPDETQLAKYISLALVVNGPPDFKPAFKEEALPPDAREVLGFLDLLKEFYQKAR